MLILLDRDGVLNEGRAGDLKAPDALTLLPGAADAVRALNEAGHIVALLASPSTGGRGALSAAMLGQIHHVLRAALARSGARLDHIESGADMTAPDLIRTVMARFRKAPSETVMIGEGLSALMAAQAAGIARILIRTGQGAKAQAEGLPPHILPVSVYDDLSAAAAALTGRREER